MCFVTDDYPEFSDQSVRKARKGHTCHECGDTIRPGTYYTRYVWKFDGDFGSFTMCFRCNIDHRRVYDAEISHGCGPSESSCPLGELHNHMREADIQRTARPVVAEFYA